MSGFIKTISKLNIACGIGKCCSVTTGACGGICYLNTVFCNKDTSIFLYSFFLGNYTNEFVAKVTMGV